jgi:hypothetical protein
VDYYPQTSPRFYVIYQLTSLAQNLSLQLKVPVNGDNPKVPTATRVYSGAIWRERELFDMFGIEVEGHPDPRRILMPDDTEGHPLRRDFPLGYEEPQFTFNFDEIDLRKPYAKDYFMSQIEEVTIDQYKHLVSERALTGETMLLNMGPQHPSTHGVLRLLLELDGEIVVNCIPDIGFLHTGIEKNMEAKTYQKAEVMTDRLDYMNTMGNNLAYCMAVEKLVDLDVPARAQALRVILVELQRIASHLVWLGTSGLDLAAMSMFLY